MKVATTFTGTDTRASNFCSPTSGGSGGNSESGIVFGEWAVVFSRLPGYDKKLFTSRHQKLIAKFEERRELCDIVNFLKSVHTTEIPWFVHLCLEYLENVTEETMNRPPDSVLTDMLRDVLRRFTMRKESHIYCQSFNRGQAHYICNFSWNSIVELGGKGGADKYEVLRMTPSSDSHIHRHLGFLFGYPDAPQAHHFSLANKSQVIIYRSGKFPFKPWSVFPSFADLPLMGLVLFGTSADHCSFIVQNRLERCTSCHLMTSVFQGPLPAGGCLKTGQELEILTHLAIIQASRMGGLTWLLSIRVHCRSCKGIIAHARNLFCHGQL
jgi:hypothetical protein